MKLQNTQLAAAFLFMFTFALSIAQPAPPPGKSWKKVNQLSDEFNGGFDGSKWTKPLWNYGVPVQMRAQNSGVSNGKLWIKATLNNGSNRWFETSRVMSKAQIKFPMYTECSMKTAHISAYNTFWTNNGDINNRDEIDIVENNSNPSIRSQTYRPYTMYSQYFLTVGGNDERAHGNFDNRKLSPNNPKRGKKWNEVYHTVGMWWKDSRTVQFYLDGEPAGSIKTTNRRFTRNQNLIWDLWTKDVPWLGGLAVKSDLNNNAINTMYVDYVRTYQLVDGGSPNPPNPPAGNKKPTVNFSTPSNGASLNPGANINVTVTASDSDGSVSNVRLYVNNAFVRQENVAPYQWNSDNALKNMKAGTYTLRAEATDNRGAKATTSITVRVGTNTPPPPPPSSGQLIANGLYSLKSPSSNERLLSRAAENFNAQMIGYGNFTDQQWTINHLGNNVYTLQNLRNKRYLEVPFGRCGNGQNVATWTGSSQDHQKWRIVKNGSNYSLQPMHCTTVALDRAGGAANANLHTWSYATDNPNQQWQIIPVANPGRKGLESDVSVSVFPNPANNTFTIAGLSDRTVVTISNIMGQQIATFQGSGTDDIVVDTTSFAEGVYLVQTGNSQVFKVVIQH